ncbi:TPA: FAD-binding protein, partial [Candidatus Poribacteria bacterium]|nr:FAD-binding protein [Candidatus Poribacteria bacterium]
GLFAAGECACVSVHGANRLGGNSLLETIVFGKISGASAARYVRETSSSSNNEVLQDTLKSADARIQQLCQNRCNSERQFVIREEMRLALDENLGLFREEKSVAECLKKIRELKERAQHISVKSEVRYLNQELYNAIELGYMLDLAELIAIGALRRQESRGSHFRLDYPKRDDQNWLKHTMACYTDEKPEIRFKNVTITKYEPEERKY